MKPIYIFCPHYIRTGGPEALHQLSDALIEQGFDARLVYFNHADITGVGADENGRPVEWLGIPREFPEYAAPSFEEYARYKVNVARSIDTGAPCVIVLPETLAHMTALFPAHVSVVVWWLSADNALGALAKINLNVLRRPHVRHAAQSQYAARVIEALQLPFAGMLSDYTVDLTEYAAPLPWQDRPKLVTFATGRKVIADLDAIIALVREIDPEIECAKIEDMSRREIAELFARARVYVDLGCFPGKDRGPREAASMGCNVMVGAFGAAPELAFAGYRETGENSPSARAGNIVTAVITYGGAFAGPNIANEIDTFRREVKAVFSAL